ncbi:hypothetical protein DPEC_G00148870 [Dallia pectoralis]|uniref:Uncharacterized protein n=1 Tax=Dallia pectoralis TaxID=75939 RepID=A0ACC2GIY4_DALPE|nr:hypothetical protein DPEC_G00148870 [Dallia pectoralis]
MGLDDNWCVTVNRKKQNFWISRKAVAQVLSHHSCSCPHKRRLAHRQQTPSSHETTPPRFPSSRLPQPAHASSPAVPFSTQTLTRTALPSLRNQTRPCVQAMPDRTPVPPERDSGPYSNPQSNIQTRFTLSPWQDLVWRVMETWGKLLPESSSDLPRLQSRRDALERVCWGHRGPVGTSQSALPPPPPGCGGQRRASPRWSPSLH